MHLRCLKSVFATSMKTLFYCPTVQRENLHGKLFSACREFTQNSQAEAVKSESLNPHICKCFRMNCDATKIPTSYGVIRKLRHAKNDILTPHVTLFVLELFFSRFFYCMECHKSSTPFHRDVIYE